MDDPLLSLQETFEREASGVDKPLSLPWSKLDFALGGGLRPGTFSMLVGEPGSSKTFVALAICLFAELHDWKWAYWPFERDSGYAARRLLSVLQNDWSVLDPTQSRQNADLMNDEKTFNAMARMTQSIEPNPRQMQTGEDGDLYIPRCEYRGILNRLRLLCEDRDLVILDPLSMLSFDDAGKDAWSGQEKFAKDAAAIVAQTRSRLLIVHHSRKNAPGGKPRASSLDEAAGSAALTRFADNVVFLEHNADGIDSEVITPEGFHQTVTHRRTLFIGKARDGRGSGWRVACDLGEKGPMLTELGFIQRKGK